MGIILLFFLSDCLFWFSLLLQVALHAEGSCFPMTPLTLSCTLWFGEFTVSQGGCFWSPSVCVWISMLLMQSICYTSSGTNASNFSFDCVVPQNLWWFMCVKRLSELTSCALLWCCTSPPFSAHLISYARFFSLHFKGPIKCWSTPTTSSQLLRSLATVDQGHLPVTPLVHDCVCRTNSQACAFSLKSGGKRERV